MIKEAIVKLADKEDLSYEMAEQSMDEIMSGQATPVQMSAFLIAPFHEGGDYTGDHRLRQGHAEPLCKTAERPGGCWRL